MTLTDFIAKYKFAIIGTLLIHLVVFEILVLTNMSVTIPPTKEAVEVFIPLDETLLEINQPETPENSETIGEDQELMSNDASSQSVEESSGNPTSNQSDNFNANSVDEEVMNELKNYESNIKTTNWEDNGREVVDPEDIKNNTTQSNNSTNDSEIKTNNTWKKTGFSYDVSNPKVREIRRQETPNYKCREGGTVVVNITVNQMGEVTHAEIDERQSSKLECLRTESIKYAKKCTFNSNFDAPTKQTGWIKYVFQKQ